MSALTAVTDPLRSSRRVWGGICWIASLLMVIFGGVYLVLGIHGTIAPAAFAVLTEHLPGGMHTYGGILVIPALAVIHGLLLAAHRGLAMRVDYLRRTLWLLMVVSLSAVALFLLTWITTGTPTWGSMALWSAVFALGLLAYKNPPPPRVA